MPAAILHLHIQVEPERRGELLEFLRDARAYYEQPGGIRMRLFQKIDDENAFVEVFEYDTIDDHRRDEDRVANDPQTKTVLTKWRSLLKGKPIVETYVDLTDSEL
jgi:hypothetical protein